MSKLAYTLFKRCLTLDEYIHVENDASYFIERHPDHDGIITIHFEWSNGKTDWKNNFDFPAKPYRDMKDKWFCHRGFLKVWKSIEPHIAEDILDPKVTIIKIVGYSHGGAIAQLCHEYVRFHRPDVMVIGIAIGAPRIFWGFARKKVAERFENCYVFRNGRDIVTRVPPVIFGYRHICPVVKLPGKSINCIKDHYPEEYLKAIEKFQEEDSQ
jgi:hypothetical protein